MRIRIWLLCCLLLSGCGSVEVEHYAGERPQLDLSGYFSRPVQAWGIFQNRSGEVVKRFKVDITSHREGERLILDERFLYSDGTRQQRVWSLLPARNGRWRGRAAERRLWFGLPVSWAELAGHNATRGERDCRPGGFMQLNLRAACLAAFAGQ